MRQMKWMVVALVLAAVPAAAQDEDKKVNFNLGGGYTFAFGEVRDHLGDGYNINVGLTYNVNPMFGVQVEYSFNGLGEKQVSIPVSAEPEARRWPPTSTPA